jgi:hypothetical protein
MVDYSVASIIIIMDAPKLVAFALGDLKTATARVVCPVQSSRVLSRRQPSLVDHPSA